MIQKNSKLGFTLVELMVIMLFVTLVIAAAAPIITKRIKDVPRKLQHGKYICYRDENGNLKEDYYNSSKFVRTIDVAAEGRDQCKFTPPAKASLFRIELVGAGAGGYDFAEVKNVDDNYEATYLTADGRMDTSSSHGSGTEFVREPSNEELYRLLYKANYSFSVSTGSAGSGGSITLYNAEPKDIMFKFWNGHPNLRCNHMTQIDTANLPEDLSDECKEDIERMIRIRNSIENPLKDVLCKGEAYRLKEDDGTEELYWSDEDNVKEPDGTNYNGHKNHYSACKGYMSNERTDVYYWNILEDIGAFISDSAPQTELEVRGSTGGYSKSLYYSGVIDYMTADGNTLQASDDIKGYLKRLLSGTDYVQKGSVPVAGSCSGFSTESPKSGTSGASIDLKRNIESDDKHKEIKADDGTEVDRFAAFVLFAGYSNQVCVTTTKKPTPGKGASVRINDFQIWYRQPCNYSGQNPDAATFGNPDACNQPGENMNKADNIIGGITNGNLANGDLYISNSDYNPYFKLGDYGQNRYPNVRIYSTLNKRVHRVGNGGRAGEQATYYTTTLADDCQFIIPSGGDLVRSTTSEHERKTMEENLATKLSCNEGSLNYKVAGGTYDYTIKEETYTKFSNRTYSSYNGGWSEDPEAYETVANGGDSVFRSTDDMFTKYKITDKYSFGAGGKGAKITDRCTWHYGGYKQQLVYYRGSNEDLVDTTLTDIIDLGSRHCNDDPEDPNSDITIDDPTPGQSGAVIISW